MLKNRPSQADLDAEDRRIEVAAARETALRLASDVPTWLTNVGDILGKAQCFEVFLLEHQAHGQQALEVALATAKNNSFAAQFWLVFADAEHFVRYLETGLAIPNRNAPAKPCPVGNGL